MLIQPESHHVGGLTILISSSRRRRHPRTSDSASQRLPEQSVPHHCRQHSGGARAPCTSYFLLSSTGPSGASAAAPPWRPSAAPSDPAPNSFACRGRPHTPCTHLIHTAAVRDSSLRGGSGSRSGCARRVKTLRSTLIALARTPSFSEGEFCEPCGAGWWAGCFHSHLILHCASV